MLLFRIDRYLPIRCGFRSRVESALGVVHPHPTLHVYSPTSRSEFLINLFPAVGSIPALYNVRSVPKLLWGRKKKEN